MVSLEALFLGGQAIKLVFIHGSGGWGGVWRYQLEAFPEALAPTLPGHPDGEPITTVEGYVNWLHSYLGRQGYRDMVLAGHSMGGAIVMQYALKHLKELKAIILLGTGARLRVHPSYLEELETAVKGNTAAWEKRLTERYQLIASPFREELCRKHKAIGPTAQLNDLRCCDKFDMIEGVRELKLPTLVIGGADDVMTPVKYHDYLAEKVPGAKKVIIPGTTHHMFAEKPGEFNQAIKEFLAGL